MRVTGNFRGANRETYRDYRETDRTFRETAEKPSTATDGASDFDSFAPQAEGGEGRDRQSTRGVGIAVGLRDEAISAS